MKSAIIALTALAASVSASSLGSAIVINKCSDDVWLWNTPSDDGVHTAVNKVLSSGDSYSQQYTELENKMGWSLKLSNTSSQDNVMQYEYTYLGDGVIWYDMSNVNGNPWSGNWAFSSDDSSCKPTHCAYQYSTDDQGGMQSDCDSSASITVTLCAFADASDGSVAGTDDDEAWMSAVCEDGGSYTDTSTGGVATVYPTSQATSSSAPSTTSSSSAAASTSSADGWNGGPISYPNKNVESTSSASSSPTPTTFSTSTVTPAPSSSTGTFVIETAVVYTTVYISNPSKRDVHHHQHHARHPHAGHA
jgi:hypothetical protein